MSELTNLSVSVVAVNPLKKVAQEKGHTVETLADEVIRQFLQREAEQKMQQEMAAFRQHHAELWANYPQHHVAFYQGKLIDRDEDRLTLWQRIEANYPTEVVLIRQVTPDVERVFAVRSPRLAYNENRSRPKLSIAGFDKLSQRSLSLSKAAKVLISNCF